MGIFFFCFLSTYFFVTINISFVMDKKYQNCISSFYQDFVLKPWIDKNLCLDKKKKSTSRHIEKMCDYTVRQKFVWKEGQTYQTRTLYIVFLQCCIILIF